MHKFLKHVRTKYFQSQMALSEVTMLINNIVEPRRFRESDSQGVGSLHFFQPETPELAPLPRFRDSRSLRLHGTKMTKF